MYKLIMFLLVIHLLCSQLKGQDTAATKTRYIKTTVTTNQANNIRGYLVSVDDSSLFIAKKLTSFKGVKFNQQSADKVDYTNISNVVVKRKGAVGKGALYGAIAGAVVGAAGGFISGDDPPCPGNGFFGLCLRFSAGEKATAGALAGATLGSVTGLIVGALVHKTFKIGGNHEAFNNMKIQLVH